jgi:serine/threonine protein kinase
MNSAPSNAGADLPQIPGYQVEVLLGRGGMGIVCKALHLRLNRFVALKMLLAGAYARSDERERFLRDASAIDRFSADEKHQCLALWQSADVVLTRARDTKRKRD